MTNIILKPRRTGQTAYIVKYCCLNGITIVSESFFRIGYICKEQNLEFPKFISHKDFINKNYNPEEHKGFCIDQFAELIKSMTDVNVLEIHQTTEIKTI